MYWGNIHIVGKVLWIFFHVFNISWQNFLQKIFSPNFCFIHCLVLPLGVGISVNTVHRRRHKQLHYLFLQIMKNNNCATNCSVFWLLYIVIVFLLALFEHGFVSFASNSYKNSFGGFFFYPSVWSVFWMLVFFFPLFTTRVFEKRVLQNFFLFRRFSPIYLYVLSYL